jgi:hypothetical protein
MTNKMKDNPIIFKISEKCYKKKKYIYKETQSPIK